jgi:hypothetical protein
MENWLKTNSFLDTLVSSGEILTDNFKENKHRTQEGEKGKEGWFEP